MTTILELLGTSTPVSEIIAREFGLVRAAVVCRVMFYEQLEKKVCSASIGTIAHNLGLSSGTVSTNLKWLRDNGYIEIVGFYRKGNKTNHYRVTSKFLDLLKHSADESNVQEMNVKHSADESNVQEMNGKEESKENFKKEESEKDSAAFLTEFFLAHINTTGKSSHLEADVLNDIIAEYPAEDLIYAVEQAVRKGAYNLNYIEAICKRKAEERERESAARDSPASLSPFFDELSDDRPIQEIAYIIKFNLGGNGDDARRAREIYFEHPDWDYLKIAQAAVDSTS